VQAVGLLPEGHLHRIGQEFMLSNMSCWLSLAPAEGDIHDYSFASRCRDHEIAPSDWILSSK